jgi:hypothetical protein
MGDLISSAKIDQFGRWLLLFHQLPSNPAYLRVKVWRRMQALGAIAIKNTIYALPASDQSLEDFEWLLKEIVEGGGEAVICEARLIDGLSDGDVRALFNAAREVEHTDIAQQARALSAKLGDGTEAELRAECKVQFTRLKKRHGEIVAIDFFGANGRETVDGLLGALEKALSEKPMEQPANESASKTAVADLRGHVWVTRQGVHIDRIACAWLIRRFIDDEAVFKFVLPRNYVPAKNELRFDMFDAEFTHEGDNCSFEVLMAHAGLNDSALQLIAEIVHEIDLKDEKFGREETAGVRALINGICADTHDDEERIARGSVIFDGLYSSFRKKKPSRPSTTSQTRKL